MLGSDHPRAGHQAAEPGADPGVSRGQRRDALPGPGAGGSLRLGDAAAARAGLPPTREGGQRAAAPVCGQDDGTEPGADHAADRPVPCWGRGESHPLPAASVSDPVHPCGPGTAGGGGRSPRNAQRSRHAPDPGAGVEAIPTRGVPAVGGNLGGPTLPPAPAPGLPSAAVPFHQDPTHPGVDRRAAAAEPGRSPGLCAGGHGAPRGSRWRQGRLSHQCGGRSDAVAGARSHLLHQRSWLEPVLQAVHDDRESGRVSNAR